MTSNRKFTVYSLLLWLNGTENSIHSSPVEHELNVNRLHFASTHKAPFEEKHSD